MFASEDEGIVPDLIATAKELQVGFRLLASLDVLKLWIQFMPADSAELLGAPPIACAAALGAIATIEEENLCDRAKEIGTIISDALNAMKAKYSIIGEVRGRGAMQAIELVIPGSIEPNPCCPNFDY